MSFLCAISGEPPRVPVVSPKSGRVFERSLIEAFVDENGEDPITGTALSKDDLIAIEASNIVRPKNASTATSIPTLLASLQTEWDAMALEIFELKKELQSTRKQLSTALYYHDAAVRVAARLTKERDEAREALTQLTTSLGTEAPAAGNGAIDVETMDTDFPTELSDNVQAKLEVLSAQRKASKKARAATVEVDAIKEELKTKQLYTSVSKLAITKSGLILTGGGKSLAGLFSKECQTVQHETKASAIVTSVAALSDGKLALGSKNGHVAVYNDTLEEQLADFDTHISPIVALVAVPAGSYVISADKSGKWAIHDYAKGSLLFSANLEAEISCAQLHPDGELLALGTAQGQVAIYSLRSGNLVRTLDQDGPISAIAFSENGYSMALSNSTAAAAIYHLGKVDAEPPAIVELETVVAALAFDPSGKYLAAAGPSNLAVCYREKKEKAWVAKTIPGSTAAVDVAWINQEEIATVSSKGSIHVYK
ncbi:pre-mRNA-processing factor 19 [Trichomonascus vanleenenianus]|uniref:E3 ubiquitin-protein ligase PRP19 n=1 Tax=Trichomonascus vanleenenianus TaxID=2268995 RepID=UPI003EC9987A